MLWEVVSCTDASLGYKLSYAFDVRGKVVSEPSGDFGSGVVESEGKFKLLMWVGSHGVLVCRGTVVDSVLVSPVLCQVLDGTLKGTRLVSRICGSEVQWCQEITMFQGNSRRKNSVVSMEE